MENKHYYDLLKLTNKDRSQISQAEIANAFRTLALKYHPIINPKSKIVEFQQKFFGVAEAFDVLSKPVYRKLYDEHGKAALGNGIESGESAVAGYSFNGDAYGVFKEFFGSENPYFEFIEQPNAFSKQIE